MEDLGNEKKQRWKPQGKLYFKTKSQGMKKKKNGTAHQSQKLLYFQHKVFQKRKWR